MFDITHDIPSHLHQTHPTDFLTLPLTDNNINHTNNTNTNNTSNYIYNAHNHHNNNNNYHNINNNEVDEAVQDILGREGTRRHNSMMHLIPGPGPAHAQSKTLENINGRIYLDRARR